MAQISISELLDRPDLIPTVITWNLQEWPKADESAASTLELRLMGDKRHNQLPVALIALEGSCPVGYISLIELELVEAKGQRYWIDGLYVEPSHRGSGLGSQLLQASVQRAAQLGLDHLSAYTTQVSFYLRNGWVKIHKTDRAKSGPIIVRREISAAR